MRATKTMVTAEQLLHMPRGEEHRELIRGAVVTVAPPDFQHGAVSVRIASRLAAHVDRHDLGVALGETGFVLTRDPDTVRAPDVSFVSKKRLSDAGQPAGYQEGAPDLAVEIVSPHDRDSALQEKVEEYLAAGTRMVLIVDPARRAVRVCRPDEPEHTLRAGDRLDAGAAVPGWSLEVGDLFDE